MGGVSVIGSAGYIEVCEINYALACVATTACFKFQRGVEYRCFDCYDVTVHCSACSLYVNDFYRAYHAARAMSIVEFHVVAHLLGSAVKLEVDAEVFARVIVVDLAEVQERALGID